MSKTNYIPESRENWKLKMLRWSCLSAAYLALATTLTGCQMMSVKSKAGSPWKGNEYVEAKRGSTVIPILDPLIGTFVLDVFTSTYYAIDSMWNDEHKLRGGIFGWAASMLPFVTCTPFLSDYDDYREEHGHRDSPSEDWRPVRPLRSSGENWTFVEPRWVKLEVDRGLCQSLGWVSLEPDHGLDQDLQRAFQVHCRIDGQVAPSGELTFTEAELLFERREGATLPDEDFAVQFVIYSRQFASDGEYDKQTTFTASRSDFSNGGRRTRVNPKLIVDRELLWGCRLLR